MSYPPPHKQARGYIVEQTKARFLQAASYALEELLAKFPVASNNKSTLAATIDDGLGVNTVVAMPPPSVEMMRAMLQHLAARNYFEHRSGVEKDDDGRIIKVGWLETGMALKAAYGDEDGSDLWAITHIDERAHNDAPEQWKSFADGGSAGHVTIGTIIKAAKDAGFASHPDAAHIGRLVQGGYHGVRASSRSARSRWTPTTGSRRLVESRKGQRRTDRYGLD